jgi:hypothetical protein
VTWVAKRDYPVDGVRLVASGQRLYGAAGSNFVDGIRWKVGGVNYELFFDVFLDTPYPTALPQNFRYRFQYWYTKVKFRREVKDQWVIESDSKSEKKLITSFTTHQGVSVVGSLPGGPNLSALSIFLPRFGYMYPRSPMSWVPDTTNAFIPRNFGWKNKCATPKCTQYSSTGIPGRGPGGSPWLSDVRDPGTKKPGDEKKKPPKDDETSTEDTPEDKSEEKEPKIPGWNKKRVTLWNPPLIQYATGAYVPLDLRPDAAGGIDRTAPGTRNELLGSGGYATRIARKGYIRQYLRHANDWRAEVPSEVDTDAEGAIDWTNSDALVEPGKRYGFRFHYNPSSIEFGIESRSDVNPAIVMSMPTRVMPITNGDGGNTVSVRLFLNRIEDYSLIRYNSKSKKFVLLDESMYGGKKLSQEDMKGIVERGTMWDMEYFFRSCIGRPFKSEFRGTTADFGFIFGVPLELKLGQTMRYYGRITGASYAHTSFTQNMVPLFTELSFTYVRYPDGTAFTGNPSDKGGGKNKNKNKNKGRNRRP